MDVRRCGLVEHRSAGPDGLAAAARAAAKTRRTLRHDGHHVQWDGVEWI